MINNDVNYRGCGCKNKKPAPKPAVNTTNTTPPQPTTK